MWFSKASRSPLALLVRNTHRQAFPTPTESDTLGRILVLRALTYPPGDSDASSEFKNP